MNNAPQTTLKIIFVAHFVLTFWGSMSGALMPAAYLYLNAFVLAFGFWAIVNPESPEPVMMYLIMHAISVVQDIVLLGIYAPRGYDLSRATQNQGTIDEYRFSLGMAIVDLLIKPVTGFLLFRILRSRSGEYSEFTIPGVSNFPGFGGSGASAPPGGYENIDHPSPYRNNVETATGHDTMDKPPLQQ
ncbi:type-1 angiotensin II receptor-associated protein-like isoform X2 [Haliotis rufescens]|uniref:type-1 angiotensin II receptor-associated protein-like isoform X2 n=1 Tax=Haliotis rufescens TaxID=6454 RepID=UPI00201F08D9|nr:type-1 angiotensin II receptor-associated protein-like isoform X2 [Haliotis rufescens]